MNFDPVIPIISSLLLSYIFVVAGLHKWQDIAEFKTTLTNYQIVPDSLLGGFSYIVPVLEIVCGVTLLLPPTSVFAAFLAATLLLMYIFGIAINLLKGRRSIDCGCGGTEQKQSISEWLIIRNGLLLVMCYCVTASVLPRELLWFDWIVVLLAAVIGGLFYNILNQLLVNKDLLKVLRSHG